MSDNQKKSKMEEVPKPIMEEPKEEVQSIEDLKAKYSDVNYYRAQLISIVAQGVVELNKNNQLLQEQNELLKETNE